MEIKFVRLYDIYGALLSERQKDILDLYYNEDQSLSEISENVGITRQGVRDCIVKAETMMKEYEKALGLLEKTDLLAEKIDGILSGGSFSEEEAAKIRALKDIFA